MTDTPNRTDVALRTLQIIRQRGWTWSYAIDDAGRLNVRSAVAKACSTVAGQYDRKLWYELYLDTVHAIGLHLGVGITEWEFGITERGFRVRDPHEVEAMLSELIQRLDKNDIEPRAGRRPTKFSGL